MTIKDLDPKIVWGNFYALTQIPRPSKHEEKVEQFLYEWGHSHGVETIKDETGNIIMRKGATPGFENRRGVILQAHMDMVPQKTADTEHDFLTDPIQTEVLGEWVGAKGTTLGADDGIGVALAMSVMEDNTLKHGPVEVLITYDEETGMTGAESLAPGMLQGDILLNLDSEDEGELCIGCAGGLDAIGSFKYETCPAPEGYVGYSLVVKGLQGGHSGMDITLGRGNANKILARTLLPLISELGVKVCDIHSGNMRNAIPFQGTVKLLVPARNVTAAQAAVAASYAAVKAEYSSSDPLLQMFFDKLEDSPKEYIQDDVVYKAVKCVLACVHGVERMDPSIAGLPETSTNLAIVATDGGVLTIHSLLRSSVDSAKAFMTEQIKAVFDLAGADFLTTGGYNGWTPKPDTPVYKIICDVWKKLSGKEMEITATHGGLECAILGAKYPNWEMASIGPTIVHPHSPDERVKIDTVKNGWEFLVALLEAIPEK